MAGISSTSGAPAAAQFGLQQLKLQEAKRNAERAEQTAQALRVQADGAQRSADRAQNNARALAVQSDQADGNAGQARRGLSALQAAGQIQTQLTHVVEQVTARQANTQTAAPTPAPPPAPAVVNPQGQVTGTVINVTA